MSGEGPVVALRKAARDHLVADAALVAALGGPRIHDVAPRGAAAPWIAFGETRLRDWSTGDRRGADLTLQLDVVSDQPGSREALTLAEGVVARLDDAALAPDGWRLVRLVFQTLDVKREAEGRLVRAQTKFRALLEAL